MGGGAGGVRGAAARRKRYDCAVARAVEEGEDARVVVWSAAGNLTLVMVLGVVVVMAVTVFVAAVQVPDKLIDPTSVSHMFRLSENHGCVSTGVISTCWRCSFVAGVVRLILKLRWCSSTLLFVIVWVGLGGGVALGVAYANSCS